MSINNWVGVGRLTKDVDLRYSANGKAIANFTVACNRPFKNQNGESEADFINCVQFGKGAESTANYMRKGSLVGLTGRIQTRNYENKQGQRVYVTEVVANSVQFLESKNQGNKTNQQEQINAYNNELNKVADMEPIDIGDSDLPF